MARTLSRNGRPGQEMVLEKSDKPFPLGDAQDQDHHLPLLRRDQGVIAALQKGEIDASRHRRRPDASDSPDLDKIAAAGIYKVHTPRVLVGAH